VLRATTCNARTKSRSSIQRGSVSPSGAVRSFHRHHWMSFSLDAARCRSACSVGRSASPSAAKTALHPTCMGARGESRRRKEPSRTDSRPPVCLSVPIAPHSLRRGASRAPAVTTCLCVIDVTVSGVGAHYRDSRHSGGLAVDRLDRAMWDWFCATVRTRQSHTAPSSSFAGTPAGVRAGRGGRECSIPS